MNYQAIKKELETRAGVSIQRDVPLDQYTSFGIGGPGALFAQVGSGTDASKLLSAATEQNIPVLVLGGGTNLLVSDEGFSGLVLKTEFHRLELVDEHTVVVGASVPSLEFVEYLVARGFSGFAFAAGLPGSVGGAVAGNAGCFGSTFSDNLVRATLVRADGSLMTIDDKDWFQFAYRQSAISKRQVLISELFFSVCPGDPEAERIESDQRLLARRTRHPAWGVKTAGSYFKNLDPETPGEWRRPAGALLDKVGAKNISVGDAAVFEKHANILINRGNATARDVLELEGILKRKVLDEFGVMLEPEVRFVGQRPEGL